MLHWMKHETTFISAASSMELLPCDGVADQLIQEDLAAAAAAHIIHGYENDAHL